MSPVPALLVGLPAVSVRVSFTRDEALSFDGVGTTASWDTGWALRLTCVWRRPPEDARQTASVDAARHRLDTAGQVARLWAARALPVEARTFADQVHAALRLAEIDARLAALEPGPEEP